MEREILFRGKRVGIKEWVYGFFVKDPLGHSRIYWQPFEDATSNTYHFVISETVGQFTGLLDKNGVKIFDGDIINCPEVQKRKLVDVFGIIEYAEDRFTIKWITKTCWNNSIHVRVNDVIVVGNIHDKSELLNSEL